VLIDSEIALGPGAPTTDDRGAADIRVVVAAAGAPLSSAEKQLTWDGCCRLSLSPGGLVTVEPSATATPRDLELAVSGSGLALALQQRSLLVLHGSCVAIDGQAVCLLGKSGAGKSTLAAALLGAGHALVSDAMTAIQIDRSDVPRAMPGLPVLKLWPSTVQRLGLEAQRLGSVHAASDKLLCAPSGPRVSTPLVVRWFVGISRGEPVELVRLAPSAGVMTLLHNLYLLDDTSSFEQPDLLRRAAHAVQYAGVAQLQRGMDLDQLDGVVARIEALVRSSPQG